MKRVWTIAVLVALVLGIAWAFVVPVWKKGAVITNTSQNLVSGRQLATLAAIYATAHEGRFPICLSELVPDYLPPDEWEKLLFAPVRSIGWKRFRPEYDWLYFGALLDNTMEDSLLIASPQALHDGQPHRRIVAYGNGRMKVISEEQYQADLRRYLTLVRAKTALGAEKATKY